MRNLIEAARRELDELLQAAYSAAVEKGTLPPGTSLGGVIEAPGEARQGDFACLYAPAAAKTMGLSPSRIAAALLAELKAEGSFFSSAEAAGPGYLNFTLSMDWYAAVLDAIQAEVTAPARAAFAMTETQFLQAVGTGPELAQRQDGGNPLYRARYACARLDTLIKRAGGEEMDGRTAAHLLAAESEKALLRRLAILPETLERMALQTEKNALPRYLVALTEAFYRYYYTSPFKVEDPGLFSARLCLAGCIRRVLDTALQALGLAI